MKDSLTKSKGNENQSINDQTTKSPDTTTSEFVDQSPEAIRTREFQSNVDESDEMRELSSYQGNISNEDSTKKTNETGIPDELKASVEQLSGYSLDDVKVHYNSDKPTEIQAFAYTEGTDIYVGPGQEKYLSEEVWHVVQQKKGGVKPTLQLKGQIGVNDDSGLEKEADVMGSKATKSNPTSEQELKETSAKGTVVQRAVDTTLIDRFKQILNLKEVTIIEVPNDATITLDTKFKDYPADNVYNIAAIRNKSLLDVNHGAEAAAKIRADAEEKEYIGSKAFDIVHGSGGGGYMHTVNTAMYNEGTENVERAILHEMGHAKQNEELNANFGTANQIILEYHNIMLHENLFVNEEEGKDQAKRTKYGSVVAATAKSKDKTWKDFEDHATGEKNDLAGMNDILIKGILRVLAADKTIEDEVKSNLIIEYFNKV